MLKYTSSDEVEPSNQGISTVPVNLTPVDPSCRSDYCITVMRGKMHSRRQTLRPVTKHPRLVHLLKYLQSRDISLYSSK